MNVHENYDLAPLLWYKIGGKARYFLECKSRIDVLSALDYIDKKNISKVFFLGIGSNLIFTDEFYDGAVIYLAKPDTPSFTVDENIVSSYSGEILGDLILFSFEHQLTGLEWAGGLPGTVGAGVRGNVGAFGGEIKDCVVTVEVAVIENGQVRTRTLTNDEMNFSYRTSEVKLNKKMIILSSNFQLKKSSPEEMQKAREVYNANIQYRKDRHPLELPNCGSVFKNISKKDEVEKVLNVWSDISDKVRNDWYGKVSMGYIINRLGFAEYRVGNAQVSGKHNNFIVNLGGAKASNVKQIISEIQQKVQETFGFTPEVEVEIVE